MFWGLIMEPQRRYSQKVNKSFHVSMAALDITATNAEPTQIICTFEKRNYLLCTLQKDKVFQVPLDLNFEVGDTVCFAANGAANVHLTGYLTDEFDNLDDSEDVEDEANESDLSASRKRQSVENNTSPPKKKSKTLELLAAVDSQKETDSEDSDFELEDALGEEEEDIDTSHVEEDEESEEEESDAEEGDSDSADEVVDDDDEDESSLSDEDEGKKAKTAEVNGVSKREKREKKVQEVVKEEPQTPSTQKDKKQQQKTPKSEKKQAKIEKTPKAENKLSQSAAKPIKSPVQKRTIEGGVIVEDLKAGNGPVAKPGKIVQVFYEGRFKNNNKMFDSTTTGSGFKFRLGKEEVIKGWDVGVAGMKVGGKRRIICPPNMAYGQKGSPPAIPPNSTLVFEVELKHVK